MTVTATAPLARVIALLRTTLSESAEFQSECGGSAAAALNHIHLDYFEDQEFLDVLRPCALITEGQWTYSQVGQGAGIQLSGGGVLLLELTRNSTYLDDHLDSKLDFLNWADQVIEDLADASGVDDAFPAVQIDLESRARRTRRSERSPVDHDFWWTRYALTWSSEQQ